MTKDKKRTSDSRAAQQIRKRLSASLHRRPCRWDVLIAELAVTLHAAYRRLWRHLADGGWRLPRGDLPTVACMLAQGFDVLYRARCAPGLPRPPQPDLWALDADGATALADEVAAESFDPLLQKYVEDMHDRLPPRPDDELARLVEALADATAEFLASRCAADGDLHDCLTDPLADPGGDLPGNDQEADPVERCGEPVGDVYALGLTVRPEDDPEALKATLVHFVVHDPWLFAEHQRFLVLRVAEAADEDEPRLTRRAIQATDDFVSRATRLDGKTPIELLLERQAHLTDEQKRPLERWSAEAFVSIFRVRAVEQASVIAVDLVTDREYRIQCDDAEFLAELGEGSLLTTRVAPWGDDWLFSGVQTVHGSLPGERLAELARRLRADSPRRYEGHEDALERDWAVQHAMHDAWRERFGQDEALFETGAQLEAAVRRFYRSTRGLRREGLAARPQRFAISERLRQTQDVGAVFDREHGLLFLARYGWFRSAFEGDGALSLGQIATVQAYLRSLAVEPWVLQRMRERRPERTEQVLREALRDEQFQLPRDFEPLLRKYKGEAMRRPVVPSADLVEAPY